MIFTNVKKEMESMELTQEQLIALRRFRGEKNIPVYQLADEIGISRYILRSALNGQSLRPKNVKIINDWLLKQYVK